MIAIDEAQIARSPRSPPHPGRRPSVRPGRAAALLPARRSAQPGGRRGEGGDLRRAYVHSGRPRPAGRRAGRTAVNGPAEEIGVEWSAEAIEAIVDRSDGFPFFVQTWAYHVWNAAHDEPVSSMTWCGRRRRRSCARRFVLRLQDRPNTGVGGELRPQALASLGPGPHRSGEVAAAVGRTTSQVAAFRDRLIAEGVIYAPRYGWVEFAIPHFDEYVRRRLPSR